MPPGRVSCSLVALCFLSLTHFVAGFSPSPSLYGLGSAAPRRTPFLGGHATRGWWVCKTSFDKMEGIGGAASYDPAPRRMNAHTTRSTVPSATVLCSTSVSPSRCGFWVSNLFISRVSECRSKYGPSAGVVLWPSHTTFRGAAATFAGGWPD